MKPLLKLTCQKPSRKFLNLLRGITLRILAVTSLVACEDIDPTSSPQGDESCKTAFAKYENCLGDPQYICDYTDVIRLCEKGDLPLRPGLDDGFDLNISLDHNLSDAEIGEMMNFEDQGVPVLDAGGMMNPEDQGVDDADMGEMMNSADQGVDDADMGEMMNSADQGVPVEDQMPLVEDQAVEVDAMLPENSVEDFNDPDLIMVNNSYPTCFVNFPRQEMSLRSIFQRFFHGLNDGSIEFSEVCPTQFSNIDVEYSAVMPELREEIIANGCYVFTGFNFITSHLHSNQVFTESHFLEDVVTRNVYEIRNRNDRYWIKVYSTTGTTTNITHCDE
ncbi:hypothetical protein HOJ01_02125 [bacterium]|nr:hypothetical protein [bacterium]